MTHRTTATGPVALRARRSPRQARSQVTVSAMLDATVRVLRKQGYDACTTKRVAEVAGVGIGSLYEYFPNKEALFAALVERETEAFMAVLQREMVATFDRPFDEALRTALAAALCELESRRELVRVLLTEYPYVGQLTALVRLPKQATELAAFCLRSWGSEVCIPDHPATYYVLTHMLAGACLSQMLRKDAQLSSAAMLDALVEILLRVLQPGRRTLFQAPSADAAE